MGVTPIERMLGFLTPLVPAKSSGRSASQALVGAGLAWWNRKFAPDDRELARLESQARRLGIGLWQDRRPVPPWRHRGRYRSHARH
jgi:endonuclease YncB( thermonuclease family)